MLNAFTAARHRVPSAMLHAGLNTDDKHMVEAAMLHATLKLNVHELEMISLDIMEEAANAMSTSFFTGLRAAKTTSTGIGFRFDRTNPSAVQWAKDHAAELVKGVNKTTRKFIRKTIVESFQEGIPPRDTARLLLDAVGDEARALTIARTETMRAANEGQEQLWKQAVDQGLLSTRAEREWIVANDDRLCPICEPMDGERAPLNGLFTAGDGSKVDIPPVHPNCRCVVGLAFARSADR